VYLIPCQHPRYVHTAPTPPPPCKKKKNQKCFFNTKIIHSFIEGTEPTGEDDSDPPEKEEENPRKNEGREKQR
jgi:hypothetical protein